MFVAAGNRRRLRVNKKLLLPSARSNDTTGGAKLAKGSYDDVVNEISAAKCSCARLADLLRSLGFTVRKGSSGNHQVYSHPCIPPFTGSNYNCGHGKNPTPKPVYFRNICKVLRQYETELRALNQ
jgi:hypothetical protein